MSAGLDEAGVRHVARLARLVVPEAQLSTIAAELGRVLEYMTVLNAASVGAEPPPRATPAWRTDEVTPSLPRPEALAAAAAATESAFMVPKVVT